MMKWIDPSFLLVCSLIVLLIWAGIEDARLRTIANWKVASIALLAPLWWWANGAAPIEIGVQIGIAIVVFAVFCAAFHFGAMGGGDVKLIGALALWLPLQPLMGMLIVMSLVGGVVTVVMIVDRSIRKPSGTMEVPYGVAIAIAGLLAIYEPLLNHFPR